MPEPTLFPIDPVAPKPVAEPVAPPVAEALPPPVKPPRRSRRQTVKADAPPAEAPPADTAAPDASTHGALPPQAAVSLEPEKANNRPALEEIRRELLEARALLDKLLRQT